MSPIQSRPQPSASQSGFALILALLSLMLLTTLGLALSTSTTTELQIAVNQRWSESARFNAEAGLEYGRNLLATTVSDFNEILPPVRTIADWTGKSGAGGWSNTTTSPSTQAPPGRPGGSRNWENWKCDTRGFGAGNGVVFDTGSGTPEQYRTNVGVVSLNGAFTLWVRRPVRWNGGNGTGGFLEDYPGNDALILVSEGVAPYGGASNTSAFAAANRAVYTVEALVGGSSGTPFLDITAECAARQGQAGGSAQGTNSSGCVAITQPGAITGSLAGGTDLNTTATGGAAK